MELTAALQFPAQHELRKRILLRFRAEGIAIPFPGRDVHLYNHSGLKESLSEFGGAPGFEGGIKESEMAETAEQSVAMAEQHFAVPEQDSGQPHEPFRFYTELRLVQLTGLKARTIRQLLAHLHKAPGSSIFYHTHQRLLEHHFEKPVAHNDFALWVTDALQEDALGEKLAFIDLREYTSVRQLREAIIGVIENHLARCGNGRSQHSPPGEEFHFRRSRSFIMPSGPAADTVEEFFELLPSISNLSLYFHFLESRLRLGFQTNDFSVWLESRGKPELAHAINALNPYTSSLDELKADIVSFGRKG